MATRKQIEQESKRILKELGAAVEAEQALVVVKAPPGSGKTYLLVESVAAVLGKKLRVAVAAQTNAQADEICQRLVGRAKPVPCFRFYSSGGGPAEDARISSIVKAQEIPEGPCVVVATTAKWEFSVPSPFDVVFVDEAWQMPWGRFLGLGNVASRFVLIGDPGQIPPVVPVDASRWETAPRPPHHAAPSLVLADPALKPVLLELPVSRRLPHDSAELVNSFYDFRFGAYAAAGERRVELSGKSKDGLDSALDQLSAASISGVTLACPGGNPPLEVDDEIAQLVIETSRRLLARKAVVIEEDQKVQRALTAQDIGIVASHRVMLARIDEFLPAALRKHIRVDTAERWQGLERAVMIAVHPLSGVSEPSAFDLATGRLCVMASRHRCGLVVVSRDHIGGVLEEHTPTADQPLGQPDVTGRGHSQHLAFWGALRERGSVREQS